MNSINEETEVPVIFPDFKEDVPMTLTEALIEEQIDTDNSSSSIESALDCY